jgi:4-amino-4-deoxy-L-arabinose transferase-like glycosyltransferase
MARTLSLALLLLGALLRVHDLPLRAHTPDEDQYVNFFARPLFERGPGHVSELVREYNAKPAMYVFPPPTRVGYLWMLWIAMEVAGEPSMQVAVAVSCVAAVAGLVVLWVMAEVAAGPWAATIALGFAATSPLERAMARRAWGDGPLAFLTLLALAALTRWFTSGRRARWGVLALAFATAALLCKESGALVLAAVAITLASGTARARWRCRAAWLGAGVLALAIGIAIVVVAAGGLEPLRLALAHQQVAGRTNPYVLKYQIGGPELYLRGYAILQPVPIFLGLAAALVLPWWRWRDANATRAGVQRVLAAFAVGFFAIALALPSKSMRFLSPIYPALEVLAAALLVQALAAARARVPKRAFRNVLVAVVAALALSAVGEQLRFEKYFVTREIPDLTTPWLTP